LSLEHRLLPPRLTFPCYYNPVSDIPKAISETSLALAL